MTANKQLHHFLPHHSISLDGTGVSAFFFERLQICPCYYYLWGVLLSGGVVIVGSCTGDSGPSHSYVQSFLANLQPFLELEGNPSHPFPPAWARIYLESPQDGEEDQVHLDKVEAGQVSRGLGCRLPNCRDTGLG